MRLLRPGERPDLAAWQARAFSPAVLAGPRPGDRRDRFRRVVGREAPGDPADDGPFRRVAEAIRRYQIFPPDLLEGVLARTPVAEGDTVGICYRLPLGTALFFAARVVACFEGPGEPGRVRAGFTYRTLPGHPELGEETFAVVKELASGEIAAELTSWSRPGLLVTRAAAPLLRRLQIGANERALAHLAEVAARRTGASG